MIQITLNNIDHDLPETWQEIPKAQLPTYLRLLYATPENGTTYHELLRLALGYTEKQWSKWMKKVFSHQHTEATNDTNATVLAELLRLISWMWTSDLTIQPFESLSLNGQVLLLPEEGFTTMSFGELSDAYIHAQAFIQQLVEGEERLNILVATLCRPRRMPGYDNRLDWNGDHRKDYNEHIARNRAVAIAGLPFEDRMIVLLYFLGTLKEFLTYYDLHDFDGPPQKEDYPGQSLIKNQYLLAEKGIFGGMDHTRAANIYTVYNFLEEYRKDLKAEREHREAHESQNS